MPRFLLLPVFVLLAFPLIAVEQDKQKKVVFEQVTSEPHRLQYLLSLPTGYNPANSGKKWPLMIFLHGAGERGDDIEKVKIHGPPKLVKNGKSFPFILISPQCPKDGWWSEQPVMELLNDVEKRYAVDPKRVYLTGLSMGGYGAWFLLVDSQNGLPQ